MKAKNTYAMPQCEVIELFVESAILAASNNPTTSESGGISGATNEESMWQ